MTIAESISQMNVIYTAGYSVSGWCADNNIYNPIIYVEEQDWMLVEPIALSFQMYDVAVKAYLSDKPFNRPFSYAGCFGRVVSSYPQDVAITADDTILILKPDAGATCIERFNLNGAKVYSLTMILNAMFDYVFYIRPFTSFIQRNPDVFVLIFQLPIMPDKNLSANEQSIIERNLKLGEVIDELKKGNLTTDSYRESNYNLTELLQILNADFRSYIDIHGMRVYEDVADSLVNIRDGHRLTIGQPECPKRNIFLLGGCRVFGVGSPDTGTIASFLQRLLNANVPDLGFAVENYGGFVAERFREIYNTLQNIPVKAGDIVCIEAYPNSVDDYPAADLRRLLERPHEYGEVFIDTDMHYTENGNRAIASAFFSILQKHQYAPPPPRRYVLILIFQYTEFVNWMEG